MLAKPVAANGGLCLALQLVLFKSSQKESIKSTFECLF